MLNHPTQQNLQRKFNQVLEEKNLISSKMKLEIMMQCWD